MINKYKERIFKRMFLIISNEIDNELHKYHMIITYHYLLYLYYMIDLYSLISKFLKFLRT